MERNKTLTHQQKGMNAVQPNILHIPLLNLVSSLETYTNLEFYTDGSLVRDDDIPTMGHGWIFTTDMNANITYSGASRE
ncbi:hypothetical protein RhiirC2_769566 [Rhizophagus irregularis]|uniref:Uncharacterized protein n=1 Tax=Rhizophagus irregularis TaxID=588596 RepID=A0A2N1NYS5_9GLOM|nr:hypothetical protein RhiirC2_769566 [Rhizophagus irregularis]